MAVPKFEELFNPLLSALRQLGGSGAIEELEEKVAEILDLSEEDLEKLHGKSGNRTRYSYNLAWARSYLKAYGLLENSSRGVWALKSKGQSMTTVDENDVKREVRAQQKPSSAEEGEADDVEALADEENWREELLEAMKTMEASAFERLCQRILRESGFIQVEVTGKSGDGGIDGRGFVKIGPILSFHVQFQCKRYKDAVSSPVVRDFRGAMVGRADKGIIMTTGRFTKDARKEALRDGAPPLDLVDGEDLVEMLVEYGLGVDVSKRMVREVTVDKGWFQRF
jgi:restriction system protein